MTTAITEGEPALTLTEVKTLVSQNIHPRITEESIKGRIESISYVITETLLTICVIRMKNGFEVIGKAKAADPRNHNSEAGKRYAYEDAFRQLWPLEGYLLCEKLWMREHSI